MMQRIAVLGSLFFWNNIKQNFSAFPQVQFIHFPYMVPEQSIELIDEAAAHAEILLFAGSISYYYCMDKIKAKQIQAVYIPFDELTLSLSLLSIQHNQKVKLSNMSIDLPKINTLYQVLKEADIIQSPEMHAIDYAWVYDQNEKIDHFQIDDYITFHKELYKAGKTELALTSLHAVYEALQQAGIPASYMVERKQTFISTVNKALNTYKNTLLISSQIAVVSIRSRENSIANKQLWMENLEKVCKTFHARIAQSLQEPYLIFSTRGAIETLDRIYLTSLMNQFEVQFETSFRIGIGFGYSLHEAESHASQALFFTTKFDEHSSVLCLVDEENRLHGPLFENNKNIALSNNDQHILEIAEKLKMSAKNLNLIRQFNKLNNNRPFSATELAMYLNLSRRSAERMINRLIEQKYLVLSGEEHPYHQGRPRKLYKATNLLKI